MLEALAAADDLSGEDPDPARPALDAVAATAVIAWMIAWGLLVYVSVKRDRRP